MLKFKISKFLLQDIVKKAVQLSSSFAMFTRTDDPTIADDKYIVCLGRNEESTQSIYAKIQCDIEYNGYVYVDGIKLFNLIKKMNGEIEFEEKKTHLSIKCNNSSYRLLKDTIEAVPLHKFHELTKLILDSVKMDSRFKCSDLFDAINSIKFVMQKGYKEFCNSILLRSNPLNGILSLITTDEHTFCVKLLPQWKSMLEDQRIDKDNLNYILKTFDRDGEISLLFTEDKVIAYNKNILFSFNKAQYKWPDLSFIDNFVYSDTIIVNIGEFGKAIERICAIVEMDKEFKLSNDTLRISLSNNIMIMTIPDKCEEKIIIPDNDLLSIDYSIGMDPIKIRAMLKNIRTKDLKIHFSTNKKTPILFEENENSKYYICQKR